MRVLVDTNILLRSAQPNHPFLFSGRACGFPIDATERHDLFLLPEHRRILECRHATRRSEWDGIVYRRGTSRNPQHRKSIHSAARHSCRIHSLERDCGRAKSSGRQSIRRATRCPYERLRDRANSYVQRSGFYPVYQHRRSSPGIYLK